MDVLFSTHIEAMQYDASMQCNADCVYIPNARSICQCPYATIYPTSIPNNTLVSSPAAYSEYASPPAINLLFSNLDLRYSYTVNVTAWPGATRMTRGVMPL